MALDEARRYELHEAARRTLGDAPGDTLMEMLPPVGWADVATKHDLVAMKGDLVAMKDDFALKLANFEIKMQSMVLASEHRLIFWIVGSLTAGLSIAVAVAVARSV
ncbi:MAG: hypothetical protein EXQ79_06975 [Acidimicrobiia bacterium]|nr:hypothetical protein [Acidimicrobiia bacterium]